MRLTWKNLLIIHSIIIIIMVLALPFNYNDVYLGLILWQGINLFIIFIFLMAWELNTKLCKECHRPIDPELVAWCSTKHYNKTMDNI